MGRHHQFGPVDWRSFKADDWIFQLVCSTLVCLDIGLLAPDNRSKSGGLIELTRQARRERWAVLKQRTGQNANQ